MPDSIESARARKRAAAFPQLAGRGFSLLLTILVALAAACGSDGRDVHDTLNSRNTGQYISIGRTLAPDGSLLVHVVAERPEHAEELSRQIVRQNYGASPPSIRVVVDPAGAGTRQVFRWDREGFRADASTEGLPAAPRSRQEGVAPAH